MSDQEEVDEEIELPHGACLDVETGMISLPVDRVLIMMTIEEFKTFAAGISDIAVIVEQVTKKFSEDCPTCGTHLEFTAVVSPDDDELDN